MKRDTADTVLNSAAGPRFAPFLNTYVLNGDSRVFDMTSEAKSSLMRRGASVKEKTLDVKILLERKTFKAASRSLHILKVFGLN